MAKGSPKYRKMQNTLDNKGIMTAIVREGKKTYSFIVNGEVVKTFSQRTSANKQIVKLYKQHNG